MWPQTVIESCSQNKFILQNIYKMSDAVWPYFNVGYCKHNEIFLKFMKVKNASKIVKAKLVWRDTRKHARTRNIASS